jgi:hypothetical protein
MVRAALRLWLQEHRRLRFVVRNAPLIGVVTSRIQITGDRDQAFASHAHTWGLFPSRREISANAGLRGGPGRTRTSNQTVMSDTPLSEDPAKSDD